MYISLHNQTHYSILDALSSPEELINKAVELGMTSIAITDHGSFAAIWESYKIARKKKIKLLVGCEYFFKRDPKQTHFNHIILLAKNAEGYKNMLSMNFEAFQNSPASSKKMFPVVTWDLLEKYSAGTVCLTACGSGILAESIMEGKISDAEEDLKRLIKIFGRDNLGVEIQANNLKRFASAYSKEIDQNLINRQLIKLADKYELRIVPSCNSHYTEKTDSDVHDFQLSIGSGQSVYSKFRLRYELPEFYLKSEEEIKKFFKRNFGEDFSNKIVENTVYFSNLCEEPVWIDPKYTNPSGKEMPDFPVQDQRDLPEFYSWLESQPKLKDLALDAQYLRFRVDKGMQARNLQDNKIYTDRLEEEFEVIEMKGFSSYMLVVMDFIEFALGQKIAVGPGRGSIGGCLIAYFIGIHQSDPIEYDLIFARFLNKEKQGFPDIDTDISARGRDTVKNYLSHKYGKENTAQVSNIGTITPKVYARDVARSFEFGGSKDAAVDLANSISGSIDVADKTLEEVTSGLFQEYCNKYPEIMINKKIVGKPRSWGTHAAGLVLGKRPLKGLVPLRIDKDGSVCLELTKDAAEELGLVKMDLLGLKTLDIMDLTYLLIQKNGKEISFPIPLDDKQAYELIASGDNGCVFQLGGSGGTNDLCKKMKSTSIEDISAINALARPALKEYRDPYIKTKHGEKKVNLLHPCLERSFSKTYGFGLYEESLFYLAQDVAGWDLNKADRLRKMTKDKGKYPEKVAALKEEFISDSVTNGIDRSLGTKIWEEVIDPFGGYGFNKSHSIMYSVISYQTAFLKANYPVEFLLANLMIESEGVKQDKDKNILQIKNELRAKGIGVLPPDVNKSQMHFTLIDEKTITTGFKALKSVGIDAIDDIIDKRPFRSFQDFMARVDSKKVRANTIQALAASGAFGGFGLSRRQICMYVSDYRKKLTAWRNKGHDSTKEAFIYPWKDTDEWSAKDIYALEHKFMGESFSTPIRQAYLSLAKIPHVTVNQCDQLDNKTKIASLVGIFTMPFEITIKKEGKLYGKKMYKFNFEDFKGNACSVTIFPDGVEKVQNFLKAKTKKKDIPEVFGMAFSGTVNYYNEIFGLVLSDVYDLELPPPIPSDFKEKKDVKTSEITTQSLSEIEEELADEGIILD